MVITSLVLGVLEDGVDGVGGGFAWSDDVVFFLF